MPFIAIIDTASARRVAAMTTMKHGEFDDVAVSGRKGRVYGNAVDDWNTFATRYIAVAS
jgi:hypothetical protein